MKRYILFFSLIVILGACRKFGDTNVDPNNPSSPSTSAFLTSAQRSMSNVIGSATAELYIQHLSEKQYTTTSQYGTPNTDFGEWYSRPLLNLQKIIDLNSDPATQKDALAGGGNNNQIAVARIMKAYYAQFLTDVWGDVPYSEALKADEGFFTPAYDTQEAIYTSLFTELAEAVAQIDGEAAVKGDILFGGNMNDWKSFANTLRMVMAIRISNVNPAKAQQEFESAYAGGVLTTDLAYPYLSDPNNQNPWFGRFLTRYDYVASKTMVDYLASVNDPRMSSFFEQAATTGTYVGLAHGINNAGDTPTSEVSSIKKGLINTQNAPLYIYTQAQINFYLAEAAHRGWAVNGTAQSFYAKGIEASLKQWKGSEYDATAYATYIAQTAVAWDATKADELIGQQKWVALFLQGHEAWAEWRRTGYPALTPARDPLNQSGQIPTRYGYPTSEPGNNKTNYDAAVARQGPDELNTKVWWDVN